VELPRQEWAAAAAAKADYRVSTCLDLFPIELAGCSLLAFRAKTLIRVWLPFLFARKPAAFQRGPAPLLI
jgi:hypothetical protein